MSEQEKRYRTTVSVNASGGKTIVHTPIRTPEEYAEWWAHMDRIVRETFPGRRLKPDQPLAPKKSEQVS